VHQPDEQPSPLDDVGPAPSDRSLLRRLRQGSDDAATALYLRYVHRLRALAQAQTSARLARLVDTEDIVQSIFGSFFRGASQGFYEVPAGEELWRLFVVIALNKIRAKGNYFRAAKRDVRVTIQSNELDERQSPSGRGYEEDLAFLRLTVEEALEKLPPQHKQVVTLRIEGHEVAEIAQQTGRSHRTVERILQHARQRLTELLQGD
jgi:RNA polymerase sigma-70 factor (ECF subfamily)